MAAPRETHPHRCLDCDTVFKRCSKRECIFEADEDVVMEHCGCVEYRAAKRQRSLERYARIVYDTDRY